MLVEFINFATDQVRTGKGGGGAFIREGHLLGELL